MSRLTVVLVLFCVFASVLAAFAHPDTPTQDVLSTDTRTPTQAPGSTSTVVPSLTPSPLPSNTASQVPTATPTTILAICPTDIPVNGADVFTQNTSPGVQTAPSNCQPAAGTPYWIAPPTAENASGPLFAQDVSLAVLGIGDLTLFDPQGSAQFRLTIPDNWQMQGNSYLQLNVKFFQDTLRANTATNVPSRGNIYIYLDNQPLTLVTLDSDTQTMQNIQVALPLDLLQTADHRHTIRVSLDTLENCLNNINARLFLSSAQSFLHLEYQEYPPLLDLGSYPRPFYNNELITQVPEVYLVLPDQASAGEWQAAASLAAGLGQLVNTRLKIHSVRQSELTPQQRQDNNLILMGRPEDNALTAALYNAHRLTTQWNAASGLSLDGQAIAPTAGVVQLVAHPENDARAILVITGETETAIQKAAQSLADPTQRLGQSGALALVAQVNPPTVTQSNITPATTFTFADLGYTADDLRVSGIGTSFIDINFQLPVGFKTTDDAFVELHFSFANLLTASNSVVSLAMNDLPLQSIYLNTDTQNQPLSGGQHILRAAIPKDSVQAGENNDLAVRIEIQGQWGCYPPSDTSLWFALSTDSLFSLPFGSSVDTLQTRLVSQFPAPFNQQIDLHDLWFALPKQPSAVEFQQLVDYAQKLGAATTQGQVFAPRVSLGDFPAGTDTSLYNFVVWGVPSTNPFLVTLNPFLPQPFAPGTDEIRQVINNVVYQLPAQFNLGILQTLPSPWNADNTAMIITGTSAQGEFEAGQILLDGVIRRSQLGGDVVFSRGGSVTTVDTVEQKHQESAVMTALPLLSTAQAAATASPVPATSATPSPTPLPSETPNQSLSPTPLTTITEVAAAPTSFPTFEPLSSADVQPPAVERPQWTSGLLIATAAVVGLALLYSVVRLIRSRRSMV
jgi:Bacterial cellulose synthase subunit